MGFPCRRQIFLFLMLLLVNIAPLNANIQLKLNVFGIAVCSNALMRMWMFYEC